MKKFMASSSDDIILLEWFLPLRELGDHHSQISFVMRFVDRFSEYSDTHGFEWDIFPE